MYVHVHFAAEPLPNPVVISLVFVCSFPNQQFYVFFSSIKYWLFNSPHSGVAEFLL